MHDKKVQKQKDHTKQELGYLRDQMKEDGYYDGRFRTRIVETKKRKKDKYKTKPHYNVQLFQEEEYDV